MKGTIIKSTSFYVTPYYVVKCDNKNVIGSRNDELMIDPLSFDYQYRKIGKRIEFEIKEYGDIESLKYHAKILGNLNARLT